MEAWTTTDVTTLIEAVESLEVAAWAVREVGIGILVVLCIWFGWQIGGIMAPSASEMAWDGR